jgi:hypothetical protein
MTEQDKDFLLMLKSKYSERRNFCTAAAKASRIKPDLFALSPVQVIPSFKWAEMTGRIYLREATIEKMIEQDVDCPLKTKWFWAGIEQQVERYQGKEGSDFFLWDEDVCDKYMNQHGLVIPSIKIGE